MAREPRKKQLGSGGNPDHMMLGFGLGLGLNGAGIAILCMGGYV